MLSQKEYKFWFCTGSQDLYGDECLAHVAEHSQKIVESLNASGALPYEIVWKPVEGSNDFKSVSRRHLQRAYIQQLNNLLNPSDADMKGVMGRYYNSDATLYALLNLKKVEEFCQKQQKATNGINMLHFEDLLREIKLIRERRTTTK